jgi:hypothetical protein
VKTLADCATVALWIAIFSLEEIDLIACDRDAMILNMWGMAGNFQPAAPRVTVHGNVWAEQHADGWDGWERLHGWVGVAGIAGRRDWVGEAGETEEEEEEGEEEEGGGSLHPRAGVRHISYVFLIVRACCFVSSATDLACDFWNDVLIARRQVHSDEKEEVLLFDVQILADDIKKAMVVGDNRIYFSVYPKTFKGFSAILWLREHVAKVLFMDKVMSPNPHFRPGFKPCRVGCSLYLGQVFDITFDAVHHPKDLGFRV